MGTFAIISAIGIHTERQSLYFVVCVEWRKHSQFSSYMLRSLPPWTDTVTDCQYQNIRVLERKGCPMVRQHRKREGMLRHYNITMKYSWGSTLVTNSAIMPAQFYALAISASWALFCSPIYYLLLLAKPVGSLGLFFFSCTVYYVIMQECNFCMTILLMLIKLDQCRDCI